MELDMTKGSPTKLIARFIIPIIIGNIFQQFYSMADTIIVGRYIGLHALGAVGATGTISFLILGFAQGLTTGFTVQTAQYYGAGDEQGLKRSVYSAGFLSAIVTVIMTIVSVCFMDTLLTWMNTPADMYDMARDYIITICGGMVFSIVYNLLASILRAIGNSVVPVVLLIIAAFLNVGLDILFIAGFHWGVAGAAYATLVSQAVSGILCILYIWKKVPILHFGKQHAQLHGQCVRNQLSVGIPMALQYSITAVGTIMVQSALNLLGSTVVGAYSVACKVENLVTQPYPAMGATMATYGAQNRGVNDLDRISKGAKVASVMTIVYSVIIYGVLMFILPYAIRLFVTEDIEVVYGYAKTYLSISGLFFIPLGMIFLFRNLLQGCGYGFLPMMGGVVELVSRAIGAFIATSMLSFVGVCFANISAWASAGLFFWVLYLILMRRMRQDKARHDMQLSP
ncbi:MAG: MATE family efflux transporter [Lachnospiraceae bacterium]|nr:MATE family efflux transporter [Lachnospiraceae bacterium]